MPDIAKRRKYASSPESILTVVADGPGTVSSFGGEGETKGAVGGVDTGGMADIAKRRWKASSPVRLRSIGATGKDWPVAKECAASARSSSALDQWSNDSWNLPAGKGSIDANQ